MDNIIYLDNAATTEVLPEVYETMEPYITKYYGNPSSHHFLGTLTKKAIDDSKEVIAAIIGAKPQEIYFTSGGSEANSWAIKGLKNNFSRKPIHVISDTQEHHSLTESLKTRWIQCGDVEYTLVQSDENGLVDVNEIEESFQLNTRLCSIMTVNNETGIIHPIQKIAFKCKDEGCVFHTDAVQAFGYLKLDVKDLAIDLMSASAHKIHGPKGIGFLYISDEIRNQMIPLINGGQQERGLRGSTENVASIVGFAKAAAIANSNMAKNYEYIKQLTTELIIMLSKLPGVHTNVDARLTDYRHISIRIDNVRAEELINMLNEVGICVSSGSACNSSSKEPSHVLKAIGLTTDQANCTIRASLSEFSTLEDIKEFVYFLNYFMEVLRKR